MTPAQWARVFAAGWNAEGLTKHAPAGDAVAIALAAMEAEARKIAEETE